MAKVVEVIPEKGSDIKLLSVAGACLYLTKAVSLPVGKKVCDLQELLRREPPAAVGTAGDDAEHAVAEAEE